MRILVVCLWLLNLFDTVATWYAVSVAGYAREGNPLMGAILRAGVAPFFVVKVAAFSVIIGAVWMLWKIDHGRVARVLTTTAVAVYGLVAVWHVYGFLCWRAR